MTAGPAVGIQEGQESLLCFYQEDEVAKQRVGYFEDLNDPEAQCSRCRLCELICAFHHHQVGNPRRGKIRVVSLGKGADIPVSCLNCTDAPCMNICPTGALYRKETDGMVLVRDDVCIGCSMCVSVCPAGAVTLDPVEALRQNATSAAGNPGASPIVPPRCCG